MHCSTIALCKHPRLESIGSRSPLRGLAVTRRQPPVPVSSAYGQLPVEPPDLGDSPPPRYPASEPGYGFDPLWCRSAPLKQRVARHLTTHHSNVTTLTASDTFHEHGILAAIWNCLLLAPVRHKGVAGICLSQSPIYESHLHVPVTFFELC